MSVQRPTISYKMKSSTWKYFKRIGPNLAKCELCKNKLSCKISKLSRHLYKKHRVNVGYKFPKPITKIDHPVNTRKLINLVQQYPCLWDTNSALYNDSDKKFRVWKLITASVYPKMDIFEGVSKLSGRFNTLKEHFFAEKLNIENGKNVQPSVYYHDLEFLDTSRDKTVNLSLPSSVHENVEKPQPRSFKTMEVSHPKEEILQMPQAVANHIDNNEEPSTSAANMIALLDTAIKNIEMKFDKKKTSHNPHKCLKWIGPNLTKYDLCNKKLSSNISNLSKQLLLKHNINLSHEEPSARLEKQINVRELINLVKEHHCLWDTRSVDYRTPIKQVKSWRLIAKTLCPEMELSTGVSRLSSRFSVLKHNYFTEKMCLLQGINIQTFVYYEDMKFLDYDEEDMHYDSLISSARSGLKNLGKGTFKKKEIKDEPLTVDEMPNAIQENGNKNNKEYDSTKTTMIDPKVICIMKSTSGQEKKNPEENALHADGDDLFLLSLTEDMKRIPNEMKASFKCELMTSVSKKLVKYKETGSNNHLELDA